MDMDLSHLNAPQRQAVLHGDTPLLVLAGAGTGKTSVITHRMAHLIHGRRIQPGRILAVTFTNKAAREMRARAAKLSQLPEGALDIGTFHRICGRLLRRYGSRLGLDASFVIYDADDQLALVKRCLAELKLDPQAVNPRAVRGRLEQWKNLGQLPADVVPSTLQPLDRHALAVYKIYQERSLQANAVDFSDMLLHTVTLLKGDPWVLQELQGRWTHVLVDEYQDTNAVQYNLLRLLVTPQHSLTVVGDDDQSIYRWRGADIGNILRFERDFPGAEVIRLEQNYRSTQTILDAANHVIAHNAARKGKTLFSEGARGTQIAVRVYNTERDEGEAVGDAIAAALSDGLSPSDVAVLYRTNAQSRPIEEALRRRRLPYAIYGGLRFYDRKEVKDALSYLRLLVNPRSTMDFIRVVNTPTRGLGKTSLDKLSALAADAQTSLMEASRMALRAPGTVGGKARSGLSTFVALIDRFAAAVQQGEALGRLLEGLLEDSGYLRSLRAEGEEGEDRIDNLKELVAALDEYCELEAEPSLAGFLEDVALSTDVDGLAAETGQIALMTLHSAKGLEFPMVLMPGMEEGLFPHSRSLDDRPGLEEERRLCYVGITRAMRLLMLSAARVRVVFGQPQANPLSRFLSELPEGLLDARGMAPPSRAGLTHVDFAASPDDLPVSRSVGNGAFAPGTRVVHATFGEGRVLNSDGEGPKQKLTIDFPGVGKKVIVARFVEPASSAG